MHCIATSLSFWVYTIVNETIDYMVKKESRETILNGFLQWSIL